MKKELLIGLVFSLVLFSGCVSNNANNTANDTNQILYNPPVGVTPSIEIQSPLENEVITSLIVGVRVNVTNFRLADTTREPVNRENEGHIKYTIGNEQQEVPYKIVSFTQMQPGTYVLKAELVNNDGTSLSTPVFDTVTIKIE